MIRPCAHRDAAKSNVWLFRPPQNRRSVAESMATSSLIELSILKASLWADQHRVYGQLKQVSFCAWSVLETGAKIRLFWLQTLRASFSWFDLPSQPGMILPTATGQDRGQLQVSNTDGSISTVLTICPNRRARKASVRINDGRQNLIAEVANAIEAFVNFAVSLRHPPDTALIFMKHLHVHGLAANRQLNCTSEEVVKSLSSRVYHNFALQHRRDLWIIIKEP